MKKIITKQELLESNTRLQVALTDATGATSKMKTDFENTDKLLRTEFAKAFGWKKKNSYATYSDHDDWYLPTWQEIFIEQGKLLTSRQYHNQQGEIDELKNELFDLKEKVFPLEKSNLRGT